MIFKQETIQSLFTGVSSSVNSQIIKPFANAEQVIWKYNQAIQHNSLTQKGWERLLAQSDDSMRAYLTSIKGSTASMTVYTTSLQGNITGFKKVSSAISQYNTLSSQGVVEQKTFATAVSTTNGKLGTYLSGLNGAKASMGGYVKSLITAKAASIGLKVATVALNASFSMGISLLVSKLISSITEYSERISTAAEKAGEALDTTKSSVKELNSLIKEYNDLQLSNEWDNTDIETKKQLQKDINALLDDEADKLDIVNGKYEETTAELYKQKLTKLSEQEKSAYDALEAEKDALWDENKYTNLSFKMQYSKKGEVTDYDDTDMLKEYYEKYNDVLVQWKKTKLGAQSVNMFLGTQDPKNVEELITQYDRLNQLSQEMYDNGDTGAFYDSINAYLNELEERVKKIHGYETDFDDAQAANNLGKILTDPNNGFGGYIETLEEYQKVVDFINNSDYENKEGILDVLATDFYEFANQVENAGNSVDDFGNKIDVLDFSDIFNAEDFKDHAEKLKELAISGEISPEVMQSTEAYRQLLEQTGLTAEEATVKIREIALGESSLSNVMSEIQSIAKLIQDTETEITENGKISFSTLQSIAEKYPSLEQYIRDYFNGVENAESNLVEQLHNLYQADLKNYDDYYEAKQAVDEDWWTNYKNNNITSWVQDVANSYKIDLQNYATYLEAKQAIEDKIKSAKERSENANKTMSEYNNSKTLLNSMSSGLLGVSHSSSLKDDAEFASGIKHQADIESDYLTMMLEQIMSDFDDSIQVPDLLDYVSGSDGSSSSKAPTTFDWIETKISNLNDELDKLNTTVDDTYSNWTERSNALKQVIADTEYAIGLQGQAYDKYIAKAESVALPENIKTLVRNGDMWIQDHVDSDTKELIDEYSEWYNKAKEAKQAQEELNQTLNELQTTSQIDMIEDYYGSIDEAHENSIEKFQNLIDKAETQGFFANDSYYKNIENELVRQASDLAKKKSDLEKVLASSSSLVGTQAYTELQNLIASTSNELDDLYIEIEEIKNSAQENEWNYFDYLRESVSRLIDEADYLIELMTNEDLFDKQGNLTKYADATIALHSSNYEVYMANAKEYADEMKALEDDLATGGTDVIDRYNEMVDAHQDAILAAQEEKKAILDLVEEGYNAQLDALNELIDKKKQAMNAEKELHDYQKSIEEKTSNVASLQKQYDVYSNDTSEEGLAQAQKIKVELESAKADLEQTEYEKMLSDTEAMLDSLSSDFELWMNERLDNEDELLRQITSEISTKGSEIKSTLETVASDYNTSLSNSLTGIFSAESPFTSGLTTIASNVSGVTTAINNVLTQVISIATAVGSKVVEPTTTSATPTTNTTVNANTQNSASSSSASSVVASVGSAIKTVTSTLSSNNSSDDIFIYKKSYYPKDQLNRYTSIDDALAYFDYDPSFAAKTKYYNALIGSGTYTGSYSQNVALLEKFRNIKGYASGTKSATKGWHLFDEDGLGSEVIITKDGLLKQFNTGDTVFNADMTKRLWELAQQQSITPDLNITKLPTLQNRNASQSVNLGGISIGQVIANNPQEFVSQLKVAMANDRNVQKMVQEVAIGQGLGNNSMNVKKYM